MTSCSLFSFKLNGIILEISYAIFNLSLDENKLEIKEKEKKKVYRLQGQTNNESSSRNFHLKKETIVLSTNPSQFLTVGQILCTQTHSKTPPLILLKTSSAKKQ